MTFTIVPASPAHVGRIANQMREWDRIECAGLGMTPKEALRRGVELSDEAVTAFVDGTPHAMFGLVVSSALCGIGHPWMLGSDLIYAYARDMLRLGPKVLRRWSDSTPHLENLVARGNVRAIRMLRAWGFSIRREVILSAGVEFLKFEKDF